MASRDRQDLSAAAARVSVVVPARNEEATLAPLLDALLRQTHRPDEVVVADAGSTDGTLRLAARYLNDGVRAVSIGPAWPGAARNAAIREAHHEWLALIDAGCQPDPFWLEELLAPLAADPGLDLVLGDHVPVVEGEWDRIQALALMSPRDPRTGLHGPSVASLLIRRRLWAQVGGFREDLRAAEDHLFFAALAAAGARSAWAPRAVVHWRMSPGPAMACRRLVSYAEHHIRAGLFRTWHRRVMAMHAAAIVLLAGLPFAVALGTLSVLLAARTTVTAWRRRANLCEPAPLTASRLFGVAFLILAADVAVWLGAVRAQVGQSRP